MAMDWVKVEKSTSRKPEVLRIADLLGIHPDHAFGLCVRFWFWCDDQMDSPFMSQKNVTIVTLDYTVGHTGFAQALVDVGWLLVRNGSLEVPNFDRHLSQSAKKRADSLRRKQKERGELRHEYVTKKCDKVVTKRERESKSIPPNPQGLRGWEEIKIPEPLNTSRFQAALERWALVLVAKGNYSAIAIQEVVEKLFSHGERKGVAYLKAWTASNRFMPKWDDCYEAYLPPEETAPATKRVYAPKPPIQKVAQ